MRKISLLIFLLFALSAISALAGGPAFTSITPSSLARDTTSKTLIISGSGFVDPPAVTFSGTGIKVNYVVADDANTIEVNVTIAAGASATARDVIITNPGQGGSVTATEVLTVNVQ